MKLELVRAGVVGLAGKPSSSLRMEVSRSSLEDKERLGVEELGDGPPPAVREETEGHGEGPPGMRAGRRGCGRRIARPSTSRVVTHEPKRLAARPWPWKWICMTASRRGGLQGRG